MPSTISDGQTITFKDYNGALSTSQISLKTTAGTLNGNTSVTLNRNSLVKKYVYVGSIFGQAFRGLERWPRRFSLMFFLWPCVGQNTGTAHWEGLATEANLARSLNLQSATARARLQPAACCSFHPWPVGCLSEGKASWRKKRG